MNLPILLLANYRTGSSALVKVLGSKYNLPVFGEPHIWENKLLDLRAKLKQKDNKFVIKFMPDYIDKIPEYKAIYNSNCYKIKLTRQDKVAQVTSYYVAKMTNIWNDYGAEKHEVPYTVPIEEKVILESINRITTVDNFLSSTRTKFDECLTYEDLDLADATIHKLMSPENYNELYSYVKSKMLQKSHIIIPVLTE